ncbi:hypothetical protein [Acetobacter sp. LMG 32666]
MAGLAHGGGVLPEVDPLPMIKGPFPGLPGVLRSVQPGMAA